MGPIVEETQASRAQVMLKPSMTHAEAALERRQEERKRKFSSIMRLTVDVQTDMAVYEPGDTVSGKVFIRCHQLPGMRMRLIRSLMELKHLEIEVSGKEKVQWYESVIVSKD